MDDKKTLELILKFGLAEEEKIKKGARELTGITSEWKKMQGEATKARKAVADALDQGQDATKLKSDLAQIENNLRLVALQAVTARHNMRVAFSQDLQKFGTDLQNIGQQMAILGGVGLAAVGGLAAKYMQAMPLDEASVRWAQAQKDIERSFIRVGAIAANELLPVIEKVADLSEKAAEFIEANPEVIKAITAASALLAVGGTVIKGAGWLAQAGGKAMQYAPAAGVALAGVPGNAALGGGALGGLGALGVYGAAIGGGAFAGKGIGDAANRALGQDEQSWSDILNTGKQLSAIISPVGLLAQGLNAIGFEEQGRAVFDFSKKINGLGDAAQEAGGKVGQGGNVFDASFAQQNVQMWIDHNKNLEKAAQDHQERVADIEASGAERRQDIIKRFGEQAANAEARYAQARSDAIAQFTKQDRDSETDHYRARLKAAASFGVAVQRAEQDHQRNMQKLQRDHQRRLVDLVDDRDAFGIVREKERYADARDEAEDSYRVQAARRSEDFARQLADMDENYRHQRDRRRRDFQENQAQAAKDHQENLVRIAQQKAQELAAQEKAQAMELKKAQEGYDKQIRMMQTAFIERVDAMSQSIRGNTDAWIKYMQQSATNFEQWLAGLRSRSATNFGSRPLEYRANGGWVNASRPYMVGERGPELMIPHNAGTIVPTHQIMSGRRSGGESGRQGGSINMRVETQSLTLSQVLTEIDKRLARNNKQFARALR